MVCVAPPQRMTMVPPMPSAAPRLVPPAASSRPHTVTMVWAIARGAVAPRTMLTRASHTTRAGSVLGRGKDHSSFTAPDGRLLVVQVDEDAAGPARMIDRETRIRLRLVADDAAAGAAVRVEILIVRREHDFPLLRHRPEFHFLVDVALEPGVEVAEIGGRDRVDVLAQ